MFLNKRRNTYWKTYDTYLLELGCLEMYTVFTLATAPEAWQKSGENSQESESQT